MNSIRIRDATREDASAITELSRQLGYPASLRQCQGRLDSILVSREHSVVVACGSDGSTVGWIHVFVAHRVESDSFAELGGFVVDENHHGIGIGKRLLAAAEEWVICCGLPHLRVRSRTNRTGAVAFYERMGFAKTKDQCVFDKPMNSGTNGVENESREI